MLAEIVEKTPIEKILKFVIEKEKVNTCVQSYIKEISPKVEAKGFRKGQAPANVIESQFRRLILSECANRLAQDEVADSIKERNLRFVGIPILIEADRIRPGKQHIGNFEVDGSFSFSLDADFELKINPVIPEIFVSEAFPSVNDLVNKDIENIRDMLATSELVDRPAQLGDRVSLEFLDGSNNHMSVRLGASPDVFKSNDIFIEKNLNDEIDVEDISGQVVRVKITGVMAVSLPEANDELAKSAMYESLEHMRAELGQRKRADFLEPLKGKLYSEALTYLMAANPFDVPARWVDSEVETVVRRLGLSKAPDDPDAKKTIRNLAEKTVKSNIILDAIYRDNENIQLSVDETAALLEKEAKNSGQNSEQLLTNLKNSGQYELFMSIHERSRTIDFILNNAKVQENK